MRTGKIARARASHLIGATLAATELAAAMNATARSAIIFLRDRQAGGRQAGRQRQEVLLTCWLRIRRLLIRVSGCCSSVSGAGTSNVTTKGSVTLSTATPTAASVQGEAHTWE